MNVITLTGNCVREIELSYSAQGTAFAKGTIAVQRNFKNSEGNYDTDFINFKAIGKISEVIANYVKKGDKFGITGNLQVDVYEKDGVKQYYTNVVVNGFDFPSKRSNEQTNTNSQGNQNNVGNGNRGQNTRIDNDPFQVDDSSLPF